MKLISASRFFGVDKRVALSSDAGIADHMENFVVTDAGYLKKRPDAVPLCTLPDVIDGLWCGHLAGEDRILAAAAGQLWSINESDGTSVSVGSIGQGSCMMFLFDGALYVKTSVYYGRFDGSAFSAVEGYVPLVAVSCTPDGAGTPFEQLNMLTTLRRQQFSCDGTSKNYKLAVNNINFVEYAKLDGVEIQNYSVNGAEGIVSFDSPPDEGLNNLEICYSAGVPDRSNLLNCKKMLFFGGNSDTRIFLYDNDELPNYRFFSELAQGVPSAEYFPVTNYTVIGSDRITSIVQQYDRQLIFCKNEAYYSYCDLRTDANGNVFSSFPVFNLNGAKGCSITMDGCLLNNNPVTVCSDGINIWESTSVENEKNAVCISDPVKELIHSLIAANGEDKVRMFVLKHTGELFFVCGGYALIYNSRSKSWYVFSNFGGDRFCQHKSILYMAENTRIFVYDTEKEPFFEYRTCVWQSCFLAPDSHSGAQSVTGMTVDAELNGPLELTFCFEDGSGNRSREISFSFPHTSAHEHRRLHLRTGARRTLPLRAIITANGTGYCVIKGISLKLKTTERKNKHGIR